MMRESQAAQFPRESDAGEQRLKTLMRVPMRVEAGSPDGVGVGWLVVGLRNGSGVVAEWDCKEESLLPVN
jgi:hypothetical protein